MNNHSLDFFFFFFFLFYTVVSISDCPDERPDLVQRLLSFGTFSCCSWPAPIPTPTPLGVKHQVTYLPKLLFFWPLILQVYCASFIFQIQHLQQQQNLGLILSHGNYSHLCHCRTSHVFRGGWDSFHLDQSFLRGGWGNFHFYHSFLGEDEAISISTTHFSRIFWHVAFWLLSLFVFFWNRFVLTVLSLSACINIYN